MTIAVVGYCDAVPGFRRHHEHRWQLTPLGWILALAFVVLVTLAIVDPSKGVYVGMIIIIAVAGLAVSMNFPSRRVGGTYRGDIGDGGTGRKDFGREAVEDRDRRQTSD